MGSALGQYLLINIRLQASKREIMETDFSFGGIQIQSEPGFDENVPDISSGSIHPISATVD